MMGSVFQVEIDFAGHPVLVALGQQGTDEAQLVQHPFCKFVACWFCEAAPAAAMRARKRPKSEGRRRLAAKLQQAAPAGDFLGAFLPIPTKESIVWRNV